MEKALWAGFVLGAGVAAGIGPISLLCVASGVRSGFRPALGVGLGAATVDGLYALAAALGAAALIAGRTATVIQVAGGLAMVAIAVRLARGSGAAGAAPSRFGQAYRISFAATLANPATIVSWVGAFAAAVPALNLTRMETATALPAGRGDRLGSVVRRAGDRQRARGAADERPGAAGALLRRRLRDRRLRGGGGAERRRRRVAVRASNLGCGR